MTKLEPAHTPAWVYQFARCLPWVEAALERAGNTHDPAHIYDGIQAGEYQFWWHPDGCIITEVLDYPNMRVLHHFLAGGAMHAMQELEALIEGWAETQGCSRVTLSGRQGWARSFLKGRGYQMVSVTLAKELGNEGRGQEAEADSTGAGAG